MNRRALYDRLGLNMEALVAKAEADRQASIAAWERVATMPEGATVRIRLPRDYVLPPVTEQDALFSE